MRILNLYAGIGGNRKLWSDGNEVTAVENVPYIADVYHQLYPDDTVVVADAHQYLLDHYREFDFIWSSPPCPTHSRLQIPLKHHLRLLFCRNQYSCDRSEDGMNIIRYKNWGGHTYIMSVQYYPKPKKVTHA